MTFPTRFNSDFQIAREARLKPRASVGAGFIYPICGDVRTMPGLSVTPAVHSIDIDEQVRVVGRS